MNIDAFQGGFEGTKPSVMANPFDMQTNSFQQMPTSQTQVSKLEKPMSMFGQPTLNQNGFGDCSPSKNAFDQKPVQNIFLDKSSSQICHLGRWIRISLLKNHRRSHHLGTLRRAPLCWKPSSNHQMRLNDQKQLLAKPMA